MWVHRQPGYLRATLMLFSLSVKGFCCLGLGSLPPLTVPFCSVSLSITTDRQSLPSVPIALCLARSLPIQPHDPTVTPLPSVWLAPLRPDAPQPLPNAAPSLVYLCDVSLSLSLALSRPRAVPPHRCLARFATAVSPCATTKCCLQLQGRAGGWGCGGVVVGGVFW